MPDLRLIAISFVLALAPHAVGAQEGDRSRFDHIEPRAVELVQAMSALLTGAQSLAFDAVETFEEVPLDGPRHELSSRRRVALRRPDRMAGDTTGDAVSRSFVYDGATVHVLDKRHNVYSEMGAAPTIDATLDRVLERYGSVFPLGDFLYSDVEGALLEYVEAGYYLGIHGAGGVPSHHLAFEQETIDWQLWIDAGEQPVPRRIVIVYKTEDGVPRYSADFRRWNLKAALPDEIFAFEPPAGAEHVEIEELAPDDGDETAAAHGGKR